VCQKVSATYRGDSGIQPYHEHPGSMVKGSKLVHLAPIRQIQVFGVHVDETSGYHQYLWWYRIHVLSVLSLASSPSDGSSLEPCSVDDQLDTALSHLDTSFRKFLLEFDLSPRHVCLPAGNYLLLNLPGHLALSYGMRTSTFVLK